MNQLQIPQKDRSQLLQSLLKCDRPLDQILTPLNQLGWDSDEELATLHPQHLISILNRYLDGELSPVEVENWANAIESREDLAWESEAIAPLIHELANPILTRPLSADTAREWLQRLTTPRANSTPLAKIGDRSLSLGESLSYLRNAGKLQPFLLEIAQQYLLQKELEAIAEPPSEQIDRVIMEVRLQQQLVNPDIFQQWLTASKTSYDEFRRQIVYRLKIEQLKTQIAAPKLQNAYEQQKAQLDRVVLSRIVVDSADFAQTLKTQLEREGADFAQLAKQHSVVDDAVVGGVMGPINYDRMPPIIRENLGKVREGEIIGPIEIDSRYCLLKVEKVLPATLDEPLKKQLESQIFEKWLEEKLQQTNINLEVNLAPVSN